ncbi:hypothetical protein BJX76DRAFT_290455 [Aspergillus varians]
MVLLFSRDDDDWGYSPYQTADQADQEEDHHSNNTTQVIIGVVIGGVAAIAITAGIIWFFVKKRKWDRIRQCEERLIDYQLATSNSSKQNSRSVTPDYQVYYPMGSAPPTSTTTTTTASYAYDSRTTTAAVAAAPTGPEHRYGSRARGMSAPASTSLSSAPAQAPEAPPPAYQTLHPTYDPSRYSQISTRFSASFENPRSSTSTAAGNENRNTRGLSSSGILPTHSHNPNPGLRGTAPESSTWHQQYQYQSGSASNWPSSSGAAATENVSSEADNASASEQGPRRPRPALTRLITNL